MDTEQTLLAALHADPFDPTPRLALADWLEEQGHPDRAELARLQLRLDSTLEHPERRLWERRVQELLAAGVRPCVAELTLALKPTLHLRAALIRPGVFWMGTTEEETAESDETWRNRGNEVPRRRVTLTRPFYLAVYPVTQAQWRTVYRATPAHFKGPDRPAECVLWERAVGFCRAASRKTGRTVRLASEAEWEYACRAGTTTAYASGNGAEAMARIGWCNLEETQPVGQKQPNGWGLYDMHGNVWEWCADAYADYPDEDRVDPVRAIDSQERVARGGSWSNPHGACRSGCRIGFMAGGRNDFIGFRVAIDWQEGRAGKRYRPSSSS
jgi:uncharacterized protein (TIGR02996 family)